MSFLSSLGFNTSKPEKPSSNLSNHPFSENPKLSSQENLDKLQKKINNMKESLHIRIHTQSDQLTQFRIQNESPFLGKVFDTLEGSKIGNQIILFLFLFIKFFIKQDFKANTIEELEKGMEQLTRIDNPSVKSKMQAVLSYQNLAKSIKNDADEIKVVDQLIQTYTDNLTYLEQALTEINKLLDTEYLSPDKLEDELKKDFKIEISQGDYNMFDDHFKKIINQQLQEYQEYKSAEIETYRKKYKETHLILSNKKSEISKQIQEFQLAINKLEVKKEKLLQQNKVWVRNQKVNAICSNSIKFESSDSSQLLFDTVLKLVDDGMHLEILGNEKAEIDRTLLNLIDYGATHIESHIHSIQSKSSYGLSNNDLMKPSSKLFHSIRKIDLENQILDKKIMVAKLSLKLLEINKKQPWIDIFKKGFGKTESLYLYLNNKADLFLNYFFENQDKFCKLIHSVSSFLPVTSNYSRTIIGIIHNSYSYNLSQKKISRNSTNDVIIDGETALYGDTSFSRYSSKKRNGDKLIHAQRGIETIKIDLYLHYFNNMPFLVFEFAEKKNYRQKPGSGVINQEYELTDTVENHQEIFPLSIDEVTQFLQHNKLTAKALASKKVIDRTS